jgi:prevent-host-death family protein
MTSDAVEQQVLSVLCITRDTVVPMTTVSIRDLRNHGGEVVDRAARGERITITRSGRAVAELRPVRPPLSADALLSRWRRLPAVDPLALRADVDRLLDSSL